MCEVFQSFWLYLTHLLIIMNIYTPYKLFFQPRYSEFDIS